MSKISTAHDALLTRLQALYPSHTRLTDPYDIQKNTDPVLKRGFGLAFGGLSNTNRQVSCQFSYAVDFIVTFTIIMRANESDIAAKTTAIKQLEEDSLLIIRDVQEEPTLSDSNSIAIASFLSSTAPASIFPDKDNYKKLDVTISVEIFEDLL